MPKLLSACLVLLLPFAAECSATPDALKEVLAELTGPDAVDCSPVAASVSLREAFVCAESAMAASKPFRIVIRLQCPDCKYWNAAAGSADGRLWELVYDSNPTGSAKDSPTLTNTECTKLRFDAATYPHILCLRPSGNQARERVEPSAQ